MLLVHGYTGAYDRVSRRVATYLRAHDTVAPRPLYGNWSPEPTIDGECQAPSDLAIQQLARRGYLTDKTEAEERDFFSRLADSLHAHSSRQAPAYIIMPTYDCNLRCPYCFQDHMRTQPEFQRLLRSMTRATVDRIFLALPQIEANHGVTSGSVIVRRVTLFGGEPLLRASRPIVGYVLDRFRALGPVDVVAVTNATELDAYEDLLGPSGISMLQITLDGPPSEHDRRRIRADGGGTFEVIARNIDLALARGARVGVRMNIDRLNAGMLPALADVFHTRGWATHPQFTSYAAPIHATNGKTDPKTAFGSWELDQLLNGMRDEQPGMRVIRRPDDGLMGRVRKIFDTQADALPQFKASFCSAHDRMYIFDAFADVYACWERTGDAKVRLGHINEDGQLLLNLPVQALWRSRTVTSNPVCLSCRYAMYCGGGCAVLAEGTSGKLNANYCDGFAKRFRASTAEAYQDHLSGAEHVEHELACDQ
jgi:uncharacterized protein